MFCSRLHVVHVYNMMLVDDLDLLCHVQDVSLYRWLVALHWCCYCLIDTARRVGACHPPLTTSAAASGKSHPMATGRTTIGSFTSCVSLRNRQQVHVTIDARDASLKHSCAGPRRRAHRILSRAALASDKSDAVTPHRQRALCLTERARRAMWS